MKQLNIKIFPKYRALLGTFLLILILVMPTHKASAVSAIADSPCDSLYYQSLSARAWLEAQREITQNQNLILKPDSVFEYTCFDRLVRELADHADELLSETSNFGTPLGTNSMDQALQNLVGTSLETYINNNFGSKGASLGSYNLLGGHPSGAGLSSEPRSILNGPNYSCDIMRRVWQAAKCINFAQNAATDGFFTLQEYATDPIDKRRLPLACTSPLASWNTNLTTALMSGPWTNDPVQTYFNLTRPQNCSGGNCACTGSPPIPTGVRITRSGTSPSTYDEHVCLQAACRYHPGGQLTSGGSTAAAGCYGR